MSAWQSEMTPHDWQYVMDKQKENNMGVPYSHISLEEGDSNRKSYEKLRIGLDTVKEILDKVQTNWKGISKEWCSCNYQTDSYSFHIPPNKYCPLCKATINNDHYHCGVCSKILQVG